ncbi:MAG TPA: hypothetical protein VIM12_08125 [Noviherbaspirillum sp.]|jgi:hypothetical protein|uniref:hypothetical protein n=1 Tax=Noviherbaspirillum sp. TaxID=1926288 RepID=UPI002F944056
MFKDSNLPCCCALALAACLAVPLAGCKADGAAHAVSNDSSTFAIRPSAEREARHFDLYNHYRAVHDRPRHQIADSLQDDGGSRPMLRDAALSLAGVAAECSSRAFTDD